MISESYEIIYSVYNIILLISNMMSYIILVISEYRYTKSYVLPIMSGKSGHLRSVSQRFVLISTADFVTTPC